MLSYIIGGIIRGLAIGHYWFKLELLVETTGLANYTFNLKASNDEVIGRSENYTTRQGRDNDFSAVKRDAPEAPIEDLT